jgi:excisionase family DNA binding protein
MTGRPTASERLLTTREVADVLCVSAETVLRWVGTRGLPARRLTSRAIRFDAAELQEWLDDRATAAPGREAPATLSSAAGRRLPCSVPAIPPRPAALTEED